MRLWRCAARGAGARASTVTPPRQPTGYRRPASPTTRRPAPRRGRRAGSGAAVCPSLSCLSRPRRHPRARLGRHRDTPVEPGDTVQIVAKSGETWQALVAAPQGSARGGGHLVTLRGASWQPDPMPEGATSSDY